jgi:hypothetical protein
MTAAKVWFGGGDDKKNCPGRAAIVCDHGRVTIESTPSSFEIFPFWRMAVRNFVATGCYVTQTGDVIHLDS